MSSRRKKALKTKNVLITNDDPTEKKNYLLRPISFILTLFFLVLIIWLTIIAGFSTSIMNSDEHTYLVRDSIAVNIVGLLVFSLLFICISKITLLRQRKRELLKGDQNKSLRRICSTLLCAIGIIAVLFLIATQRSARSDSLRVQEIVNQWIDRNYSSFDKGKYLERYPHQAGIVCVCYLLSFIVGAKNYLAFQVANVIALVVIYKEFGDIVEIKTGRVDYRLTIYVFGLLFIPGIMYTGFVYGNLIGLALSLVSFKHTLIYIENNKILDGCAAVFAILGAMIIKQNYQIFGIALIIFLLIELIRKLKIKLVIFTAVMMLILASVGSITNEIVFCITGVRMSSGTSKWSWATMGLMENDSLYDGWYNKYYVISTYDESEFDNEKQTEICKDELITRLRLFKNDPCYAIRFFAGKNASQWNNPRFQSAWVNLKMPKNSIVHEPPWVNWLINDDGTGVISQFLNLFQFILLSGVLLHVFEGGIKKNSYELFFILAFIGGFLFHTVWEAKGQYTLSYYWLLLPLSAEGYIDSTERVISLLELSSQGRKTKDSIKKPPAQLLKAIGIGVVGVLVVILAANIPISRSVFVFDEDTASYSEYVLSNKVYTIQDGNYLIHPKEEPALFLSINPQEDGPSTALAFCQNGLEAASVIRIYRNIFGEYQVLEFDRTDYVLDVSGNKNEVGAQVWAYSKNNTTAQRWEFKHKNGNEYVVYHNGLVLTYCIEDNRFYLDKYNGSDQQKWIIDAFVS